MVTPKHLERFTTREEYISRYNQLGRIGVSDLIAWTDVEPSTQLGAATIWHTVYKITWNGTQALN